MDKKPSKVACIRDDNGLYCYNLSKFASIRCDDETLKCILHRTWWGSHKVECSTRENYEKVRAMFNKAFTGSVIE